MADEPMAGLMVNDVAEPVVKAEEEQMDALKEVWEVNEEWLMAPTTPPLMPVVQPLSVYEVRGPSTAAARGPSFSHPTPELPVPLTVIEDLGTRLARKVIQMSDADVAAGVSIGEIG
nr:hypothetical protein [Tanacetum cinerariifolium]